MQQIYNNQYIYIRTSDKELFIKDKTDHANETSGYTTQKRGVNKFNLFINQIMQDERLKDDIKFNDITTLLSKANIKYRTYCAMD